MNIYTIGFTKTTARNFFARLSASGVRTLLDVRLKADSQLSGFAKKQDLAYFVPALVGASYRHELALAPTKEMLDSYKKKQMSWQAYEDSYIGLITSRKVENLLVPSELDGACFLCSEDTPHHCHRRLAAEYLASKWKEKVELKHL